MAESWLAQPAGYRDLSSGIDIANMLKLSPSLVTNYRRNPPVYEKHLEYYMRKALEELKRKIRKESRLAAEPSPAPQGHPIYYTIKLPKFTMLWLKIKTFFQCLWKRIRSLFASAQ